MTKEKNIACCGLDCDKCGAYIATKNDDNELRVKTAKLWSEWNNTLILPEQINCNGCRKDGVKTVYCESICEIRKCVISKKSETCGDCKEIDKCKKIGAIISNNADALKNLKQ